MASAASIAANRRRVADIYTRTECDELYQSMSRIANLSRFRSYDAMMSILLLVAACRLGVFALLFNIADIERQHHQHHQPFRRALDEPANSLMAATLITSSRRNAVYLSLVNVTAIIPIDLE